MSRFRLSAPSPAMVVSVAALAVALGGTSYAAFKVGTKNIENGAITTKKLRNGAATAAKIKNGAVTGSKLSYGTLGTVPSASSPAALGHGQTLRGNYAAYGDAPSSAGEHFTDTTDTFVFPLSAAPAVHYIPNGTPPPSQCPGNVANPQATPGNLCVYAGLENNISTAYIVDPITYVGNAANRYGFGVEIIAHAAGVYRSLGTWAVTAG